MELKDQKNIEAVKVHTSENIADLLTKCMARGPLERLIDLVKAQAEGIAKGQSG